jgi:hypothetical protein
MPVRSYSNADLKRELPYGDAALPLLPLGQIADPETRRLFAAAKDIGRELSGQMATIRRVLSRPDVQPISANDPGSNTCLRAKINAEGGLFETLYCGISGRDIHDPVVAVAWEEGCAIARRYLEACDAVRDRIMRA